MNIKMNDLVGIFSKARFTPAVTSCYQVHALNADVYRAGLKGRGPGAIFTVGPL